MTGQDSKKNKNNNCRIIRKKIRKFDRYRNTCVNIPKCRLATEHWVYHISKHDGMIHRVHLDKRSCLFANPERWGPNQKKTGLDSVDLDFMPLAWPTSKWRTRVERFHWAGKLFPASWPLRRVDFGPFRLDYIPRFLHTALDITNSSMRCDGDEKRSWSWWSGGEWLKIEEPGTRRWILWGPKRTDGYDASQTATTPYRIESTFFSCSKLSSSRRILEGW